jgi:hypothetical protein
MYSQPLGFTLSSFHFINVDGHRYGGTVCTQITRKNFTLELKLAWLFVGYININMYQIEKFNLESVHATSTLNVSNNNRSVPLNNS